MIRVGTAGWSLYRGGEAFAGEGSQLQRYARALRCVEINSSFYRAHASQTYAKWAASTPRAFRFAVKLPRQITHDDRLRRPKAAVTEFLAQVRGLGSRLGPLLVQLPPSLEYEPRVARAFFGTLREQHEGLVACEPRHASWFTDRADSVLEACRVGRVAADPAEFAAAATPGGWAGLVYYRLHGSPRRYWSVYDDGCLVAWAAALRSLPRGAEGWCVFDNTAGGGALGNALAVARLTTAAPRSARASSPA